MPSWHLAWMSACEFPRNGLRALPPGRRACGMGGRTLTGMRRLIINGRVWGEEFSIATGIGVLDEAITHLQRTRGPQYP
jgi:hypothetical protein